MSDPAVLTRQKTTPTPLATPEAVTKALTGILPGISPVAGDPVSLAIPGIAVVGNKGDWEALTSDPEGGVKRRGLLESIRAILELNAQAGKEGKKLGEVAKTEAQRYRRVHEAACVALLEQNRAKEQALRSASRFFTNLQSSRTLFRNKIFAINASAKEIASEAGCAFLAKELSHYVNRPDPRKSRAFLVVSGWVGNRSQLKRLSRVAYEHRCMLVTDAPIYDSKEQLQVAAMEGGMLETLAGTELADRYTVMIANHGRARARFQGRFHEEKEDLFVPLSAPWFGLYLDKIAQGKPWKPAVGYQHPLPDIDGVKLDLLLKSGDEFDLYLRHRLNPAILLSAGSDQVVVYGPDTLSKAGQGVQIGVAVVELILTRYAEWIVNQYGLNVELEEAETVVRKKLTDFIVLNSGAGRMFRSGSRVSVIGDEATRTLIIDFSLYFREIAERAVIRVSKPVTKDKVGQISVDGAGA